MISRGVASAFRVLISHSRDVNRMSPLPSRYSNRTITTSCILLKKGHAIKDSGRRVAAESTGPQEIVQAGHDRRQPAFSRDKVEARMREVADRCQQLLTRVVLASQTPQAQLASLRVKIEGHGWTSLPQTGWVIRNVDASGHSVEVTAPTVQEAKDALKDIRKENAHLTISQSKEKLLINFDPVTGESKEEKVQEAKGHKEKFKIQIRKVRADAVKLLADTSPNKEDEARGTKEVQQLHDKYIKLVDKLYADNAKHLLG
eukprot:EG_transcript_19766